MPKDPVFSDLNEDQVIDLFDDIFYKELDSWFSLEIACCDDCYDDFVGMWPAAYQRNTNFQRNSISMEAFYSGSILRDYFTKEEFYNLIKQIKCPCCGKPLTNNMWLYNFDFNLPNNIEKELREINDLATSTPFMILSHKFAKQTFASIVDIGKKTSYVTIDSSYYRARGVEIGKKYCEFDFNHPPKEKISEGRYNHAGFPAIYLGDSEETCFYEVRTPDEGMMVAEVKVQKPIKILDLISIEDDENNILNVAAWSSLMSSPKEGEGWFKPQYTFTRFIADCAKIAKFDAIRYPSVRLGKGYNIVLLNGSEAWEFMEVVDIKKMERSDFKNKYSGL